ncbi:S-layer homology domain-containing protein [Paenibacillus doosanensis]|uniref:S-layer homology domain-containing protein n=1 Tax=Paenibacillus doosanensis TaxID=1229154 RepID=UPI00217FE32F|nr:S-layer homology domain-containing protein [Paenibacillus doosanensis]MCS7460907.1 S-layer homology domain-containing protein [Paenibacillus doosanensis]
MAALAYRASRLAQIQLAPAVPGRAFSDHSDIQSYAAEAIEKLQQAGIMDGMPEGRFAPDDYST